MKKYNFYILVFICISIISCKKNQTSIYAFNNDYWTVQDSVSFLFNVVDTSISYDISFFFRNTLDYPYRNLYLLVQTNYLNTLIKGDTIQYIIADKYGKWLGSGIGATKDNYLMFERNKKFNQVGEYKITLMHGMRNEQLIGCNKIGFKMRKNE